jgi:hypothetical protein
VAVENFFVENGSLDLPLSRENFSIPLSDLNLTEDIIKKFPFYLIRPELHKESIPDLNPIITEPGAIGLFCFSFY